MAWEQQGRCHEIPCAKGLRWYDRLRCFSLWNEKGEPASPKGDVKFTKVRSNCINLLAEVEQLLSASECASILNEITKIINTPAPETEQEEIMNYEEQDEVPEQQEEEQEAEVEEGMDDQEAEVNIEVENYQKKILANKQFNTMQDIQEIYDSSLRKGLRLVIIEKKISQIIWDRLKHEIDIEAVFEKEKISKCPRGFSVLPENNWHFSGVNECIRINFYSTGDHFEVHKDSQYCPSAIERSILSGIIYLNDSFTGGETSFYFPPTCDCGKKKEEYYTHSRPSPPKDQTTREEIESFPNFENHKQSITPKTGNCILFSPNILHKGETVGEGVKWLLKFDVLVKKQLCPVENQTSTFNELCIHCASEYLPDQSDSLDKRGCKNCQAFVLDPFEKDYYERALSYFRQAQINEYMHDKKAEANLLYERCLNIRYSFPQCLYHRQNLENNNATPREEISPSGDFIENYFMKMSWFVWEQIFNYLGERDTKNFALAFPVPVGLFRKDWMMRRGKVYEREDSLSELERKIIPKLRYHHGFVSCFEFCDKQFFNENSEKLLKIAAFYSFSLLGQSKGNPEIIDGVPIGQNKYYSVRYDPSDGTVCLVSLNQLLLDLFYNRKSYGSIYNVFSQEENKNVVKDFFHSVDRNWFALYHEKNNQQYFGLDYGYVFNENSRKLNIEELTYTNSSSLKFLNYPQFVWNCQIKASKDNFYSLAALNDLRSGHENASYDTSPNYQKSVLVNASTWDTSTGGCLIGNIDAPKGHTYHHCTDGYVAESFNEDYRMINHLVFNFEEHDLQIENVIPTEDQDYDDYGYKSIFELCSSHDVEQQVTEWWKVGICKLVTPDLGFSHAGCQCFVPEIPLQSFNMVNYPRMRNIMLAKTTLEDSILVYATYDGIVSL